MAASESAIDIDNSEEVKNSSELESVEDGSSPSSQHMSNYKYDKLDCETDAGKPGGSHGNKSEDEVEPPRKRARRGINKEVNGDIEFEIIDEVEADDQEQANPDESDDDDLSDDEIYAWLEEGVEKTAQAEKDDSVPVEKEKVVLKEKGHDPFDILPEGWVVVTHNSGMPVYLHKESRVVTLARPYFLGPGSVRKHDIPLSAIPCMQYKRELDKERLESQQDAPKCPVRHDNDATYVKTCPNPEAMDTNSGAAGTMETNDSGQETSSALALGKIDQSSKSESTQGENSECRSEVDMDSSVLVTSSKGDLPNCPVGEKSQLVTNQSKPKSPESVPLPEDSLETDGATETSEGTIQEQTLFSSAIANGTTEEKKIDKPETSAQNSTSGGTTQGEPRLDVHPVKVESAEERRKQASLDPSAVRDYCSKLFEFKTITVTKYKTWRDRRRHMTQMKKQARPELPPSTKLITCSLQVQSNKSTKRKEFLLNPSGKSYVCILHEYVQHTMRVQPRYIFKEMESALTPYSARVVISDVEYGVGYASSKKAAKLEAAKATLNILIPQMNKVTDDVNGQGEDLSFFDEIKIEDPRIHELGNKAGQPCPYQILCECLRRNYGLGETHCEMEMKQLKQQKSEFTMTVGKHTATVIAKNKRDGKQRAAQAILQKLHAHVTSWGSILRLYGKCSEKYFAEKKEDMNINELQAQVKANRPNNAILDKLKEEMTRLYMQRGAIQSKGKLRLESTELPVKIPSLDL